MNADAYLGMSPSKTDQTKQILLRPDAYTDDDPFAVGGQNDAIARLPVNRNRPLFMRWMIPSMKEEPLLDLGVMTKQAMTAMCEFEVVGEEQDRDVLEYVQRQIHCWMQNGLGPALDAMHYGWQPFEVMFREDSKGRTLFDRLVFREHDRSRVQLRKGLTCGVNFDAGEDSDKRKTQRTEPVYLAHPKSFWAVYRTQHHPYFGRSLYKGVHIPFIEYARENGITDMLAIWTRKSSITSVIITHPKGYQIVDGQRVYHQDQAALIGERYRAAGVLTIEEESGPGTSRYRVEQMPPTPPPDGLLSVATRAEDRMLYGIGVVPELVRSTSTGSFNGREIPMMTMLATAQRDALDLTRQFCQQVVKPLVHLEFGRRAYFDVQAISLIETILKRGQEPSQDSNDKTNTGTSQPPTPGKNGPQPATEQSTTASPDATVPQQ